MDKGEDLCGSEESNYISALEQKIRNLKFNDASTILSIASMVARNKSVEPADIVERIICECADGLTMLYIFDAILRNVSGYRFDISKQIPMIFKTIFQHAD